MEISWVGLLDANWLGGAVRWILAGWGCGKQCTCSAMHVDNISLNN